MCSGPGEEASLLKNGGGEADEAGEAVWKVIKFVSCGYSCL